ncbi:VirB3 family type IV secretion system protein [Bordetella pseudohinzii]|uniref:Type IV secretion system protein VirB3 n=1 Tax=Bordetella pseudohinzii TaxID=1331258 RepID=A0A0J6CBQ1_9BORD|nr:VirB3 family type IV secretion system protein [Bordetella pseudohinzii]ANY14722.1 hypothetical protein BBN53_01740 [Bordetella pseudohinzii]KMM26922.1 Type IV secretion system protein PtlB [Bordetella pseudohinzii]KXA76227.1 hypothetical protein AW877_17395 [Bordetella pseudohinzii]KXA78119.1 hypothetical protein AW878_13610 [Bordetella pseudohinzii]CUI59679.1 type IV secretion system protein VirB3 [Bordetella pseudohinzii]
MQDALLRSALFKGCTRPAMILGVPAVAFVGVVALCALLGIWFSLWFLLMLPFLVAVMRFLTLRDDQQFRLLWLFLRLRGAGGLKGYGVHPPYRHRSLPRNGEQVR